MKPRSHSAVPFRRIMGWMLPGACGYASGHDSLNQSAVAYVTGQTASANDHQVAVRLGMSHRF